MYFKQIREIIDGTKTQTRRIAKPGEDFAYWSDSGGWITGVVNANGRMKWRVGRDYAVSPGVGKPGVWLRRYLTSGGVTAYHWYKSKPSSPDPFPLRIVITAIRREPLQNITEEDARTEGWPGLFECGDLPIPWYAKLWDSINTRMGTRWVCNPDVWVIEFEVKK